MEKLLVCAILLYEKLITESEYKTILDALFIESPEDELLLELEWNSDITNAMVIIRMYFSEEKFDYFIFGKFFVKKLQEIYNNSDMDINEFGNKMYGVWKSMPGYLQHLQPFHILSYADDPLSWGDVEQTKKIYKEIFTYYDEK